MRKENKKYVKHCFYLNALITNAKNKEDFITKKNRYEFVDDYVIGYTPTGKEFYFDKEHYDLVSKYYWTLCSSGDVVCRDEKKRLTLHKLLMGDGIYVHRNGFNYDNRRKNLISIRGYKNDGKTYLNGYIAVYFPEHPRAFDNGCVYEHLLVAENILGRPLTQEECVHHKDLNRTNNDKDNLMIFATEGDHIAFHNGIAPTLQENGTYICERCNEMDFEYINRTRKSIEEGKRDIGSVIIIRNGCSYNLCPKCKTNVKTVRAIYCKKCRNEMTLREVPTKEVLEELILNYSFIKIGRMFGKSDTTIRKWCKKYGLSYKREDIKKLKMAS